MSEYSANNMQTESTPPRVEMIREGVNSGLPAINVSLNTTAYFEFWPTWLVYIPVVFYWLFLSIRYRSLSLPMIVNPNILLGGMVGESKSAILQQAGPVLEPWILPFLSFERSYVSAQSEAREALTKVSSVGLSFPMVAKPDLGCRGAGVRLIKTEEDLIRFLSDFPASRDYILQKKAEYSAEAGVFYCRHPNEAKGRIISLTLKYTPAVIGDGVSTIRQLILADGRAAKLKHLYFPRLASRLAEVLSSGKELPLVFAGSHCRGSIFKDGAVYITPELESKIDVLLKDLPEFYYGRLDIKFKNIESLMAGEDFNIIEVNGASSEATHIWDSQGALVSVFKTLLKQYEMLFAFGDAMRKRGFKLPSIGLLVRTWLIEVRWAKSYPSSD